MTVDQRRVFSLNNRLPQEGPIVYWMSRDQRVNDNWALLYAQELAEQRNQGLLVVFCLTPHFLGAILRQYGFLIKGLEEVETQLRSLHIPFVVLLGNPSGEIANYANNIQAGAVVTDFSPLRIKKEWQTKAGKRLGCAFYEVDAHNIIPCRVASKKQEFAAYTLRPKLYKVLPEYLTDFPSVKKQSQGLSSKNNIDWKTVHKSLRVSRDIPEVDWCIPGETAAMEVLQQFISERLSHYDEDRNDPTKDVQSNLSPYLHFGQISAQRIAHEVAASHVSQQQVDAFLEELIVRRELSDNYCFYNPQYDSVEGFPAWAKKTLHDHTNDERDYLYTQDEFEQARTHDKLWNAAQMQLIQKGKMHGYMRMYWAKKILECTHNPKEAMDIALYLNDRFELDGRDPNGYVGIAWSIGGVHDRAWFDRPIFGKIRYMNYNGCKSKFDVQAYIEKYKT